MINKWISDKEAQKKKGRLLFTKINRQNFQSLNAFFEWNILIMRLGFARTLGLNGSTHSEPANCVLLQMDEVKRHISF